MEQHRLLDSPAAWRRERIRSLSKLVTIRLGTMTLAMLMAQFLFLPAPHCRGQVDEGSFVQNEQSVFVPAPRDLIRPLIRARRAIEENDPSRAVTLLGQVLSETINEDYLVPMTNPEGVSVSLRLRAQAMLGSLAPKDRRLYRLRYGIQASQMLERAIEQNDMELVSQVSQRFFYTEAGSDATMLLGHHYLDHGRPIAAANCFQQIANSEEARAIHDPEASVLLATCWMLSGSPDRARQTLVQLRERTPDDSIEFLGKPIRLFERSEDVSRWLERLIGDTPIRDLDAVKQWVMGGGNPQRNARSGQGVPLPGPRWVAPTMNDPDLDNSVSEIMEELILLEASPVPAVEPLAIGNTIVMRTFDRMIGVDFATGKRAWVFPPWEFTNGIETPSGKLASENVKKTPLTERMWLDAVYGKASSDGKTIFVIPNPGFTAKSQAPFSRESASTLSREFNELVAIDVQRQGAFRWEIGGESGLEEPKLAGTFFLGPPLPLDGELFAVCLKGTEVRLVVLDADTGQLKWQQQLGTTETSTIKLINDRYRRLAGATPSFADGILVCATGTGAIVGVDIATRTLRWGYQYAAPGRKSIQPQNSLGTSSLDPLRGLWRDSPILIADGKVLFTPVDSQNLICISLQNGFPLWDSKNGLTSKIDRKDSMFLACVDNGLAILVGDRSVRAVNVNSGIASWERPLGELGRPSGKGYADQQYYYFPTTREKLIQIELSTGKIVKAVETAGVLGNLISYRGHVISHGVNQLACFPQDAPNRQRVATAAAGGELTPDLMALRAQLLFQDGKLREAIRSIESAYLQGNRRAYEDLLLDWTIRLVEEDFEFGIALALRYESQLLTRRRNDYLAAKINGMIQNQHEAEAVDELFNLLTPLSQLEEQEIGFLEVVTDEHDRGITGQPEKIGSHGDSHERLTIRIDRWIGSRIRLLHEQGSEQLRQRIRKKTGQFAAQIQAISTLNRHDLLRSIPKAVIPNQVRSELARELIARDESLRAHQLLADLTAAANPQTAATALGLTATDFLQKKMFLQAKEPIEKLATEFADVNLSEQLTGTQMSKTLRDQLPQSLANQSQLAPWNFGRSLVSVQSNRDTTGNPLTPSSIELVEFDSPVYSNFQFQFYGETGEFEILDRNGKTAYRFLARETPQQLYSIYSNQTFGGISIKDNLALIDISTEVIAFDWIKMTQGENPVLWNRSIPGEPDLPFEYAARHWSEVRTSIAPRANESRVFVSSPGFDGICYLERNSLVCIDSFTGSKLWQRPGMPRDAKLLGDAANVIVWDSQNREFSIFATSDGRWNGTFQLAQEVGEIWSMLGSKILVSALSRDQDSSVSPFDSPQDAKKTGDTENQHSSHAHKTMGLFDLLENRFVWKTDYPEATLACRVGRERIAILPPGNKLDFINTLSGKLEFQTSFDLPHDQRVRINGIGVALNHGNYLIHFKHGDSPSRVSIESRSIRIRPLTYSNRLWVGSLMCVDPMTGANLWTKNVRFDNFQIGPNQPLDAPVYLLVRNVTHEDESGLPIPFVQFAAINVFTGKLVVNHLHLNRQGMRPPFRISCEPENQQMTIESSGHRVLFEFANDKEGAPRPVAHLTNRNSIPELKIPRHATTLDPERIASVRKIALQRAIAAEKHLLQKRAEEKKRLMAEQDK